MIWNVELLIKYFSAAQASYGDVLGGSFSDLVGDPGSGFTEVQKIELRSKFSLVPKSGVDSESGFQAILLQPSDGGNKILAIRGSEEILSDFVDADGFDIGVTGFANTQAIDLYRYWRRLTTPEGDDVSYSAAEISALFRMYELDFGVVIDLAVFISKLSSDKGLGVIAAGETVDVTGHSLGGSLAYVFASMFPDRVGKVVTINAPGIERSIWDSGQDFLVDLGFSVVDESKITSVNAEGDTVHFLGGFQPGVIIDISQEVGNIPILDGLSINHSVVNTVDSLNIMKLFTALDPTQKEKPSGILKELMRASSYQGIDTYEIFLDGLRKTLLGENITRTEIGSKSDLAKRNILYNNMEELRIKLDAGGDLNYLAGKVALAHSSKNSMAAKIDYGQFLSLYFLTPFKLTGSQELLKTLHPDLYALWERDQSLTAQDRTLGKSNFSDGWYQARTAILTALTARNIDDEVNDTNTNKGENDILFTDELNSLTVLSEGKSGSETSLVRFGDSKNNDLTGGIGSDRLYGAAGNDKLQGGVGHDYLEGNAGNDELIGGEGADLLLGTAGNDTLEGGAGNDILKGGGDNDTYKFAGNFGRDIIIDAEGSNNLDINGVVSAFTQIAKDSIIYYDDINNPTKKAVVINEGNTKSLIISTITKTGSTITDSGNSVIIKNWNGSGFGISLNEAAVLPPDTDKVFTITGTNNDNAISLRNAHDTDPNYGVVGYVTVNANGGNGNDLIMGLSTGKDTLLGGDGNDVISGGFTTGINGSANVRVLDTPGIDSIRGGKGGDYIVASALAVVHGDEDDDVLRADTTLYAVIPATSRDVVWKDVQQFMNYIPEKKDSSGVVEYVTGLTFKKNLTSEFQEFASVNGGKFIAKHVDGKTTISYVYGYVDGKYYPEDTGVWDLLEKAIPVNTGTIDTAGKMQGANLFGDAGNDFLSGGSRADYLSGGVGKDTIFGGEGQDVIDGGLESDFLVGSEGDDLLIGGEGDDTIYGSKGDARAEASDNDILYGGSGADELYGDKGQDYLDGGIGLDELQGGDGDDYLYGGDDQEKDFLYGGAGNDTIVMGLLDQADGGGGENIYIWNPYQVTNTSVPPVALALSTSEHATSGAGVFGDIFGDTTSTSTTTATVSDIIYIRNTEGNNTLGIAGTSNLNDASIDISGNYLLITTDNNQQLAIQDGVSNTPVQITFGSTAEQLSNTPVIFTPLTDEHFLNGRAPLEQDQVTSADLMLAKLETAVVLAGGESQYLVGGLNNDALTAKLTGSTIIGGKGTDNLIGGIGNDTYLIRKDDGHDTIIEKGGDNHIKFDQNISIAHTTVRRNGTDLVFTFSEDQHLTVKNMFGAHGALIAENSIQDVTFYGGALSSNIWNLTQLKQHALTSTAADDIITGFDGDDTYHYSLGNGRDVITDTQGNDTIQLGAGITKAQVIVRRDANNNLILSFKDGGSITVANAFNSSGEFTGNAIEAVKFADDSTWNLTQLKAEVLKDQAQSFNGTEGDDLLVGSAAKDILIGGKGNDKLLGGVANDVYQYALGDGNDVITDTNGVDKIHFTSGITQSGVVARSNGKDLTLTLTDGAVLTVKDMFVTKTPNMVDPLITAIINQIETRWISQAETLIENHFGLSGNGDLELNFGRNIAGGHVANISFKVSADGESMVPVLTIDLNDFAELPNGTAPYYYDRLITHEMTHAVMARNMSIGTLPGWFLEGTAEFIQGADERVKNDLNLINSQSNFEALFKTTAGSPSTSAGYSVSYIAVKFLDNEIRENGGIGIHEVFDQLKAGKTLGESLAAVSVAHGGMSGLWNSLTSFETHFKTVGLASLDYLLDLNNADTGAIAGSDYDNSPLDAKIVVPDSNSGAPKHFNLVIPSQYIAVGDEHNAIESIQFANGDSWNLARINAEILANAGELVVGSNAANELKGGAGKDTLQGLQGNDRLFGYAGNDVYRYALGDGNDEIIDSAGTDQIEFSHGIFAADIVLSRDIENNLIVMLKDNSTITVKNAFDATGNLAVGAVESIKFLSGGVWDGVKIKEETSKIDTSIRGTIEKDKLYGTDAKDVLIGGKGNDYLRGGEAADSYIFSVGDGRDIVEDGGGNINEFDKIVLGTGLDPQHIVFGRTRGDLVMFTNEPNDQITFRSFFNNGYYHSSYHVYFTDTDKTIDLVTLLNNSNTKVLTPTEYSDHISGFERDDFIEGLGDSDYLYGEAGNDTISGGLGTDYLYGDSGDDTLNGGPDRDELYGGLGLNTYLFNNGDGADYIDAFINNESTTSLGGRIIFGEGVSRDDISFSISNTSISVHYGLGDVIDIRVPELAIYVTGVRREEEINAVAGWEFEIEGAVATLGDLINGAATIVSDISWRVGGGDRLFFGTSWNDVINVELGYSRAVILNGGLGNDDLVGDKLHDSLNGDSGNDTLNGSLGNDTLKGGAGNDTYVYKYGSGGDEITESSGIDSIQFGSGILSHEIILTRSNSSISSTDAKGADLIFTFTNGESLKIKDLFLSGTGIIRAANIVEEFRFFNDTNWTFEKALSLVVGGDLYLPLEPSASFDSSGSVIHGSAEVGSLVEVKNSSGIVLGEATANITSGSYSISLQTSLVNNEIVYITAKDASGNISPIKAINAPDYTEPSEPDGSFASFDPGKYISGSAEVGSYVEARSDSGELLDRSELIDTAGGSFRLTLPVILIRGEIIYLTAIDAAGNVSSARAIQAPDKTKPIAPDARFNPDGNVVSGTAEAGSFVEVKNTSGTLLGSATADASGAYAIVLATALINKQTVKVTAKDTAGNISPPHSINAPDKTPPLLQKAIFDVASAGKIITGTAEKGSTVIVMTTGGVELKSGVADVSTGVYAITLDTALINKELIDVIAKDDAGNPSDPIRLTAPDKTRPAAPSANIDTTRKIISGFAEAGSKVIIKNNAGTTLKSVTANATTGAYSATLPTALTVGQTVFITATDVATNISEPTTFVVGSGVVTPPDTTPPVSPSAAFDPAGQIVTGSAEPGALVVVRNAADTEIGSIRAHATTGVYSITLATALINKESVKVTAKDAANNVSVPTDIVAPDKTRPAAPNVTLDEENKIAAGSAEPGSWVEIKNAANTVIGSAQANPSTGAFRITLSQTLTNGQNIFTTATDADGNASLATQTQVVIAEPPQPTASGLRGSYYGYHQSSNGNINLTNVAQVLTYITGRTPAANFVAKNLQYSSGSPLGIGSSLQTFLKTDAVSLSKDPANTSDAIIKLDGKIKLDAGTYNFRVRADDGYSIRLNGAIVAEYNANQTATTRTHAAFTITQSGLQDIEIIYWDEGNNAALNVELGNTAGTYHYLSDDILFQPAAPAAIMSSNVLAECDYDAVHYFNQNHALIQAMAAFAPESSVDTRYRAAYADSNPLMFAVGQ